ncbi:MAG TPA: class I SAM-dependent methyltransferase [Nitrospiria bacterium]
MGGSLERKLCPGLKNAQYVYKDTLKSHLPKNSVWLDLGCGHQIFPYWMPSSESDQAVFVQQCKTVVGIDSDVRSLCNHNVIKYKVVGDIERLPFKDNVFQLITANMVVEHLKNPGDVLAGVYRSLKPEGLFLFHTPNFWNYIPLINWFIPRSVRIKLIDFLEERKAEDVYPAFYRMNTPRAIREWARRTGFGLVELKQVNSSPETIRLGPVAVAELLLIRVLSFRWFENFRSNLIVLLQKKFPA